MLDEQAECVGKDSFVNVIDCSCVAKGDCRDFFEAVHFNPAISTVEQSYQRFVGDNVVCFGGLVASWVGCDGGDRNRVEKYLA